MAGIEDGVPLGSSTSQQDTLISLFRPWTPARQFTSYKGLALFCAICGFAAQMCLLLGLEERFVSQEGQCGGQLLLPLSPSPQMSAAFSGTIVFLSQIGHKITCIVTPLLPN